MGKTVPPVGYQINCIFLEAYGDNRRKSDILPLEDQWILKITNGRKINKIEEQDGCKKGDNFVADVVRLILHFTEEDQSESQVSLIKKEPKPIGSPQTQVLNCWKLVRNEIQAYSDIFPQLLGEKCKEIVPICYFTTNSSLFLEDLQPLGFKMADRQKGLNFDECSKVLEVLAEFHYCSYKLKHTSPEKWDSLKTKIDEPLFCNENKEILLGYFWENSLLTALEILKSSNNPDLLKVADKLTNLKGKVLDTIQILCQSDDKFSVLCHGDLWTNNILFRYNNEPGTVPSDVKLLDFQCMRHASSALDILHLLCSSTEINLLGSHYNTLIKIYYDKLSIIQPTVPFSIEELKDEIQRKILFGIFLGFIMIPCSRSAMANSNNKSLTVEYLRSDLAILDNMKSMRESSKRKIQQFIIDLLNLGLI